MGRAQVEGKSIVLYGWKLKELKRNLAIAIDEAKRSNLMPDMLEAGRSNKSVREATGILQNCIEAAIANGLMTINPIVGVIVPKCEKVERRVLSVEEQRIFLEYLERTKS